MQETLEETRNKFEKRVLKKVLSDYKHNHNDKSKIFFTKKSNLFFTTILSNILKCPFFYNSSHLWLQFVHDVIIDLPLLQAR